MVAWGRKRDCPRQEASAARSRWWRCWWFGLIACAWGMMPGPAAAAEEAAFDIASFLEIVQPMEHERGDRLPLLVWELPLPTGHALYRMSESGELKEVITALAKRGIVPGIRLGRDEAWGHREAHLLATELQRQDLPIHVVLPRTEFLEDYAWRNASIRIWASERVGGGRTRERSWPCLPQAQTEDGAFEIRRLLRPLQEAGYEVVGVWADFESQPHPYNGVQEAQKSSPECAALYEPGVLEDREAFRRYTYELRQQLLNEMLVAPVREIFPQAQVGNYGEVISTEDEPAFHGSGVRMPPRDIGELDAMMPVLYPGNRRLHRYADHLPQSECEADTWHFTIHLRTFSSAAQHRRPGMIVLPFISRWVPTDTRPGAEAAAMSRAGYRELVRHVMLRGADGFFVFNLGRGLMNRFDSISPRDLHEMVEDTRSVEDELLAHRAFLEQGQVMTLDWPKPLNATTVWSGLRLGDECLVRVINLANESTRITLKPWADVEVQLDAPPEGQTYILERDGNVWVIEDNGSASSLDDDAPLH